MTSQMNPTDAEIAEKLDGTKCGGMEAIKFPLEDVDYIALHAKDCEDELVSLPSDLLAFCRAVVERCEKV